MPINSPKITPVLNGFIVKVGCQRVVFETREKLLAELDRYLTDPAGVEAEYRKTAINAKQVGFTAEQAGGFLYITNPRIEWQAIAATRPYTTPDPSGTVAPPAAEE